MLYPYLPEPMRNPETFEWMLRCTILFRFFFSFACGALRCLPACLPACLQDKRPLSGCSGALGPGAGVMLVWAAI